jgi:hypothetical protein
MCLGFGLSENSLEQTFFLKIFFQKNIWRLKQVVQSSSQIFTKNAFIRLVPRRKIDLLLRAILQGPDSIKQVNHLAPCQYKHHAALSSGSSSIFPRYHSFMQARCKLIHSKENFDHLVGQMDEDKSRQYTFKQRKPCHLE